MARPWSVKRLFGKRPTSVSVMPLLTARFMIAAARFSRSSSDTPEGPFNLSSKAFFSASVAACLRIYSEAFAASASAIRLLQSTALGRSSSTFRFMAHSPDDRCSSESCTELIDFTDGLQGRPNGTYLTSLVRNCGRFVFDLSQGASPIDGPESPYRFRREPVS